MRTGTPNLNLGMYDEDDEPGAGEKTAASPGINGDRMKLDAAIGGAHNTDGSHKTDVIDGPNLKATAADASTLELAGSPLKLRVKDGGLTDPKFADDSVKARALNADTAGAGLTQDAGGALQVNVDNTTVAITADVVGVKAGGVGTTQLADDAVTAAKQAHNNNRTKILIPFYINAADEYCRIAGLITTNLRTLVFPRSGSVTALRIIDTDGTYWVDTVAYGTAGDTFATSQRVVVKHYTATSEIKVLIAAAETDLNLNISPTFPVIGMLEVEFDD